MNNFYWIKQHKILSTGIFLLGLFVILTAFLTMKQVSPLTWGWYGPVYSKSGLAIAGYDAISYHQAGKVQQGSVNFEHTWQGVIWRFTSAEHLQQFTSNPASYAPQFGGFCAYAVSKGFTAAADPKAWHIDKGKLYLFADQNVKKDWLEEMANNIIQSGNNQWALRNL